MPKEVTLSLKIKNCTECPHHEVVPDPDPHDWFCSDDMAVLCKLKKAGVKDTGSHAGQPWKFKAVSVSCRPYNIEKESAVPKWCPLRRKKSNAKLQKRRTAKAA